MYQREGRIRRCNLTTDCPTQVIVATTGTRRVTTISIAPNTALTVAKLVDSRTQVTGDIRDDQFQGGRGTQRRTKLDPKFQTLVGDIIDPYACKFLELLKLEKGDNDITYITNVRCHTRLKPPSGSFKTNPEETPQVVFNYRTQPATNQTLGSELRSAGTLRCAEPHNSASNHLT
jgi:hypothetical protein